MITNKAQEFEYNQLGAVIKNTRTILLPDAAPMTYATSWTYDTWNRVTEMTYPDGEKLTYKYNVGGLLNSMKGEKEGDTYNYVKQLAYNKFEQRVYLAYGNGTEMTYTYEPTRRRLSNMKATTATSRLMMDNSYGYDKMSNILQLKNNAPVPSSNLMGGPSEYNYTYDDLYQLTEAKGFHKGSNQQHRYGLKMKYNSVRSILEKDQTQDFSNDGTSWVSKKGNTYTNVYDYKEAQPHAPVHIGDKAYNYDLNGNQTGWDEDKSGQNRQLLWDEENRLKAINDNGAAFYYMYDAAGERVAKIHGGQISVSINGSPKQGKGTMGNASVYVNPFLVVRNGGATKHFYIESQRIASKLSKSKDGLLNKKAGTGKIKYDDKQSQLTSSFAKTANEMGTEKVKIFNFQGEEGALPPGHGGINPGNGHHNGNKPNDPAPIEDPNVGEKFIFYYHPDHLGSSSYISDANGEVSQHLEYFAFGETFVEEHSNTSYTPFLFNGKELDDETGLYYYSARYFDPKTGIFESVDPLSEETMTPYAYCNNNPVNLIDPTGMSAGNPTDYKDSEGKTILSTDDGSKDVVTIPDNKVSDFKEYNAAYQSGSKSQLDSPEWNDTMKAGILGFKTVDAMENTLGEFTTQWSRQNAINYLQNPTAGNAVAMSLSEALSQWTDPQKLIMAAGILVGGMSPRANATVLEGSVKNNYSRFLRKIPANSKSSASFQSLKDGNYLFQASSPGRVPGSSALYQKWVNPQGETVKMLKTTFAPDGHIIHVKTK
jgi:RHS repeat-associated protein